MRHKLSDEVSDGDWSYKEKAALFRKKTIETSAFSAPWKILVVDDEPDVHTVTKLALSRFKLDGRALSFINAYSAEQAKEFLLNEQDLAIAFIDVVMETDHAGLS